MQVDFSGTVIDNSSGADSDLVIRGRWVHWWPFTIVGQFLELKINVGPSISLFPQNLEQFVTEKNFSNHSVVKVDFCLSLVVGYQGVLV
jgi:hypothetical protein